MTLPELVRRQAEIILQEYCAGRPGNRRGDQKLAFEIVGECATLFAETEGSGAVRAEHSIARFCYNHQLHQWTLHYPDRSREWRFYLNAGPTLNLGKLLHHVDEDPFGIFWP